MVYLRAYFLSISFQTDMNFKQLTFCSFFLPRPYYKNNYCIMLGLSLSSSNRQLIHQFVFLLKILWFSVITEHPVAGSMIFKCHFFDLKEINLESQVIDWFSYKKNPYLIYYFLTSSLSHAKRNVKIHVTFSRRANLGFSSTRCLTGCF